MSHKNTVFISVFLFLLNIHLFTCQSGPFFACQPTNPWTRHLPFCQVPLPISVRVKDLIGRLTLQEKIGLLVHNWTSIVRLSIKSYNWAGEALHGVSDAGYGAALKFGGEFPGATSFPQVILTTASFNSSLWESISRAISTEARAMYNRGRAGLTFWTPNVNIFREPRWGRGQETPGEDPFVVSTYAVSNVRGLQVSEIEDRLKVAACCKHYTAYDLEVWNGIDRFHFNALVSKQDLEETYNVPFKACVLEGKVAGIMCPFNQVNGRPTCADPNLLGGTIRGEWDFSGYIVTDCDSLQVLNNIQNYTNTPEEAAALAIKSGVDLNCGSFLLNYTEGAIHRGLLRESDVDRALANLFTIQMRLGMFDGLRQQYLNLGPGDVCSPVHQQLALEASQQGIVLLKNQNQALPLSTDRHKMIAVIGPNSNVTTTMLGNYAGIPCAITTPLQGISRYASTTYQPGCTNVNCTDYRQLFEAAELASHQADSTILVMGIDQSIEAEDLDRTTLLLPEFQEEFISRLAKASRGPVVLVLMSGGPLDVTFAKNDENINAILWVGYPGEAGGIAIGDVLFGSVNPGGRLPVTWYPERYVANVPMTDMAMHADPSRGYPGRTYRFYRGPVVFPFGYGLSYTTFREVLVASQSTVRIPVKGLTSSKNVKSLNDSITVSQANCDALSLELQIDVENIGKMDGSETVLVFATIPSADIRKTGRSEKKLVAFKKIYIAAGRKERILTNIDVCKHLSIVDQLGIRRIRMGKYRFQIGDELEHDLILFPGIGEIES